MPQDQMMLPSESRAQERYYFVPEKFPEATIYDYVRESNAGNEAAIAFDYLGVRISYGKFFRMVERTARALAAHGVGCGDVVSIVMPTQPETFYLMYACSKLGAIASLVDLRYPKDYLLHSVEQTRSKLVFASTATGDALADVADRLVMVATGESVGIADFLASPRIRESAKTAPANALEGKCPTWGKFLKAGSAGSGTSPENTSYEPGRTVVLVGTGGTTGTPKLVELSNDAINSAVFQCQHANFDFRRGDVWYDIMPPFIAYGVVDGLHLPLAMGMTVVLEPAPSVDLLVGVLRDGRVNHMAAGPNYYIDLVRREDMRGVELSMLRSPIIGGRNINEGQERAINEMLAAGGCPGRLRVGWGLTETCGAISVAGTSALVKQQSAGLTLTGGITSAFREAEPGSGDFEELPMVPLGETDPEDSCTGELWYSGPNVMAGYFENPEETAAVLVKYGGRTWLRTGDVGYVDAEGSIFITNRIKDFIARKDGFKTPPKEIEDALVTSGCIDEVAVVGVEDPEDEGNTLIVAFYTLAGADAPAAEAAMREAVAARLADYKHPDRYESLDRMPYTPIGKIDRNALREQATEIANERQVGRK